jgi:hypothetical protein
MATTIDITGALADVVEAIQAADPDAADESARIPVTADPRAVRLPGILVQFSGVDLDTLAGGTVQVRVLAIGNERDDPRVIEALEDLLDVVLAADLEISDVITTRGVQLPNQAQPMPALSIPVNVHQD